MALISFHLTWGSYGTRLHGDVRGTVHRERNLFGEPIVDADAQWQQCEQAMLKFPARLLTIEQREFVERVTPLICNRGGWTFIAVAAAADHVHCVLKADADGKAVRKWLKRWIGEALSERWPTVAGQTWWAECGSVKWIWTKDYFHRAVNYVERQRTLR